MLANHKMNVTVQTKLTVGPADDEYEQEADRVADQVMTMQPVSQTGNGPASALQRHDEDQIQAQPIAGAIGALVQRHLDERWLPTKAEPRKNSPAVQRHEEDELRRSEESPQEDGQGFEAGAAFEQKLAVSQSGGQPLPHNVLNSMEGRFGADFGAVRVHTGADAVQLNRDVQAQAFTHGSHVYFGAGKYAPESHAGARLLAHELTHVVQQGAAGVSRKALPVQRTAVRTVVQREIIADWLTESKLKSWGRTLKRSPELQAIDAEVINLQQAINTNDEAAIITAKNAIDQRIGLWKTSKGTNAQANAAKRMPMLNKLRIAASVAAQAAQQAFAQRTRAQYSAALGLLKNAIEAYPVDGSDLGALQVPGQTIGNTVTAAKLAGVDYQKYNTTDGILAASNGEMDLLHTAATTNDHGQTQTLGGDMITKIDEWQQTRTNYENFQTLEADVGQYAQKVSSMGLGRFKPGGMSHKTEGLSMPRGIGGAMTDPAIAEATLAESEDYTSKTQNAGLAKIDVPVGAPLSNVAIKAIMDSSLHETTGETKYPELESLKNGGSGAPSTAVQETTDTVAAGGATITRIYDATDANFAGRWALVNAAATQIQAAGFALPDFTVHLPKYGRQLSITNDTVGHGHKVTVNKDDLAAAQLFPPTTIMISPAYYKAPKVETGLSARIDPSGVATLVHEMGHMMHFFHSKGKFTQLNFSTWKGLAPDGTPWADYVNAGVSQYGAGNPREFVAEFFVGLVYRDVDISQVNTYASRKETRKTTAHIHKMTHNEAFLRMYKALGGPPPAAMIAQFALL